MNDLLSKYDRDEHLYKGYIERITQILYELLQQNNIYVHSITSRVKERDSLEKKIKKSNAQYIKLEDITDIGGIRITTYFEDDVKKIAAILEHEFKIDVANSIDKKAILDPDRFGYLSMHHVVSFDDGRCKYPEYQRYSGLKAEIQTRSILQHAWAEIEHDLGYKTEQGVPANIRRRFSRLAGLLELADQEFITIRDELKDYAEVVTKQIKTDPEDVSVDLVSLRAFVENSSLVKQIDEVIGAQVGGSIRDGNDFIDSDDVQRMNYFNLRTISQIKASLTDNFEKIQKFSNLWLTKYSNKVYGEQFSFGKGISIFYLGYVLAGAEKDRVSTMNYLMTFFSLNPEEEMDDFCDRFIAAYSEVN